MKTYLHLITIFAILLLVQGCKTQNVVAPPASDEVISISFESKRGWYHIKLNCTRDSIWYYNDRRIILIDTAIADTQEFITLLSSFNIDTFWSLQDNVDEGDIARDGQLYIITVTANNAPTTNTIASIVEKKLQFTYDRLNPSLQNLWTKLDTVQSHLKERLQ